MKSYLLPFKSYKQITGYNLKIIAKEQCSDNIEIAM